MSTLTTSQCIRLSPRSVPRGGPDRASRTTRTLRFWLVLYLSLCGAPAVLEPSPSQALPQAGAAPQGGAQAQAAEPTRPDRSLDYTMQPGDRIRIMVWKEPELTGEFLIRLDGQVTVPLLGDIPAAGLSPSRLGEEIQENLKRYLERPIVAVALMEANSARFFVIGQVARSGSYPMFGTTTVLQALALAGGFREFAKRDQILIVRQMGGKQLMIPFNYRQIEGGGNLSQNVVLQPGDTILVP